MLKLKIVLLTIAAVAAIIGCAAFLATYTRPIAKANPVQVNSPQTKPLVQTVYTPKANKPYIGMLWAEFHEMCKTIGNPSLGSIAYIRNYESAYGDISTIQLNDSSGRANKSCNDVLFTFRNYQLESMSY